MPKELLIKLIRSAGFLLLAAGAFFIVWPGIPHHLIAGRILVVIAVILFGAVLLYHLVSNRKRRKSKDEMEKNVIDKNKKM